MQDPNLASQVCQQLGLTQDPIVNAIVQQDAKPIHSMRQLLVSFPKAKRDALFNTYCQDDSMSSLLYGYWKLWYKENLIGDFQYDVARYRTMG